MAKILVIDDETPMADFLQACLTSIGHEVVVCLDSTQAAGLALAEKPGLAIVDFHMPRKTGVEVLADLRAREETRLIPVLFLSGTQIVRFAPHIPPEPRVRFLTKPVDLAVLLTVVREMLDPNSWSSPR